MATTSGSRPCGRADLSSLANPTLLQAIDALSQGDDLRGRTVIDAELKDAASGMPLGELEDVVVVGSAESIDRLGVVADGREIARLRLPRSPRRCSI